MPLISYRCPYCNGKGSYQTVCMLCEGTGKLEENGQEVICYNCNGNGYIEPKCDVCHGKGFIVMDVDEHFVDAIDLYSSYEVWEVFKIKKSDLP